MAGFFYQRWSREFIRKARHTIKDHIAGLVLVSGDALRKVTARA